MIKVRNTKRLQENVIELAAFAQKHGYLDLDNGTSPVTREFVDIFTNGCSGPLTTSELGELVKGIQAFVRLPVYTTELAAAWLGVGIDTIRDAIWRSQTLPTMKPGHDVLITHGELVRFRDTRG
jgi:hypothetical protein